MHIKTTEYLSMVREKTGFSDYKIAKEYDINQSNLSKYSSGKAALSETHAWLFANVLDIDPAEVVANTKLEHAIINPLIDHQFLELTIPGSPRSPSQKYRLTGKFVRRRAKD